MNVSFNLKFLIGSFSVALFILMAAIGPFLAPYEKDHKDKIEYIITEEGGKLRVPAFPPSKEHILGTDKWGTDLLTFLLYGAKYTVFASIGVALFRVIIGGGLGIYHALQGRELMTKSTFSILNGIPAFIIIYFVMLGININPVLSTFSLVIIQCMLMVLFGVSGVYQVVYAKTREIGKNLYVLAADSYGASKFHILKAHIYPTIKGNVLLILVNEVILVLNLIGQLSIFNLFFGGTEKQISPTLFLPMTGEWAGFIAQSRLTLYSTKWVLGFPLAFYLLFLFSLYLLSLGLKDLQRDKYRLSSLL